MRIFNTKTPLLALGAALCMACGCDSENIGATYDGDAAGVAFVSTVVNAEISDADENRILIPVTRGSFDSESARITFEYDASGGASDPKWVDSDPSGVFSLLTTNLTFTDNSYTANAIIRFSDIDKLGLTDKYRMRLSIKDGLSPSGRGEVVVTVNRKLTFEYYGEADLMDECMFEKPYTVKVYKADESEVYRVMDPYSEGLVAEDYAEQGWMGTVPEYFQFRVDAFGFIFYDPFPTGMLVNGNYMAYAYYPGEYQWGKDFSTYNSQNKKLSDNVFQLYPVYCLPSFKYGFLNEGAYPLTITMKN